MGATPIPQIAFALLTLSVGWVALWPLRSDMGTRWYHLMAFPVGLLGWSALASLALLLRTGYSWPLAIGGLGGYAALLHVSARYLSRDTRSDDDGPSVHSPWWTFAAWGAVVAAVAGVMAAWGIATFSHDGWAQYELYSWPLFDAGHAHMTLLGHRMIVPSAFHAGYHLFGGEFASFVYPVLSFHVAALVALSTFSVARRAGRGAALGTAVAVVVAMASHVTYLFMSIYVHSHMPSALYLLVAGVGIWRAADSYQGSVRQKGVADTGPAACDGWLLIAGLGMAGVFLARPDGPAYAMAVVLLFVGVLLRTGLPRSSATPLFAPLVVLGLFYTASTIANRGLWTSPKISADMILAFVGVYALVWAVVRLTPVERLPWIGEGHVFMSLVLAAEAVVLVWLFRVMGDRTLLAISNAVTNLLELGGWRSFWPLMTAMVVVSLVLAVRSGRDGFTSSALFYAAQFFVIAFVVHGVRHPGRLGWGDSLNRVAFHVVPLLWWYIGLYVAGLVRALRHPEEEGPTT